MSRRLCAVRGSPAAFEMLDIRPRLDGELVYVQAAMCSNPRCGCEGGFAGMSSSRATMTAKVVERPDFSAADYQRALVDSLTRGGWIEAGDQSDETVGFVAEVFALLTWITDRSEVGSHVRCNGDEVFFDRPADGA